MSSRRTKRAVVGSLMGLGRSKDGAFPKSVLELVASDTFSSLRVRDSKKKEACNFRGDLAGKRRQTKWNLMCCR